MYTNDKKGRFANLGALSTTPFLFRNTQNPTIFIELIFNYAIKVHSEQKKMRYIFTSYFQNI